MPRRQRAMGRVRGLLVTAAIASLVATAAAVPAAATDYPVVHEFGPLPLDSVTAPGSAVGYGPAGKPWLYLVSSGSPAILSVVDARTGARVHEFPLPGAAGSWAVERRAQRDPAAAARTRARLRLRSGPARGPAVRPGESGRATAADARVRRGVPVLDRPDPRHSRPVGVRCGARWSVRLLRQGSGTAPLRPGDPQLGSDRRHRHHRRPRLRVLALGQDGWPGESLLGLDRGGGYWVYSPQTGGFERRVADAVGAPAPIRSITEGPDGLLYAGSFLTGGPRPSDTDAVVFAYDLERRETLWQVAPVPGEGAIGELVFDNDGALWSHTTVTVFRLDTATRQVTAVRSYQDYPWGDVDHVWTAARLWIDPYDELVHVLSQGAMYKIDQSSLNRERWFRPASHGFLHNNGNIYLARDPRLWEYTPSARPTATASVTGGEVAPGGEQTVELAGFGPGELVEVWLRPAAHYLDSVHAGTSYQFTVPGHAPAGANQVEIRRVLTGRSVTATVTVAEPRPETQHDTVVFGEVDSGVGNAERDNGCSFLDELWLAAPFASRGEFVRTVAALAWGWTADRRFTWRELATVVWAVARSGIGR